MNSTRSTTFEPLESRQLLSAGAFDPSFSSDGKATISFGDSVTAIATDAAVQKDGKTVVVGMVDTGRSRVFAAARFNFDGTPDRSFGPQGNGTFVTPVGDIGDARAKAVAIQPDGKIVIVGSARVDSLGSFNGPDFGVVRLLPNGFLDKSFDGDGKRTINFAGGATDVAIQSDGKIVIVGENFDSGFLGFGGDFNFAVARLNANGSLDSSFDGDGKRQLGFGSDDFAESVALSGNKIIVAGRTGNTSGTSSKIAVARLNANGSRDGTFDGDGQVITAFPGQPHSSANGVILQGSKIVVAGAVGKTSDPSSMQFALARYLSNGQLDTSFGPSGVGLVTADLGGLDLGFDLTQSAEGGLIVAGTSDRKIALAGFTADGAPNVSFGTGGKVVTDIGLVDNSLGMGLTRGPGRRFVVAGASPFNAARFLDTDANKVAVGSFDPNAAEAGRDPASLIVGRTERLPFPTRVFFTISGTAFGPTAAPNKVDYDLSGITITNPTTLTAFVDIPANETFTVVTLTPRDDARRESSETAIFTIKPDAAYEIGTNPASTVSIADNDSANVTGKARASAPASRDLIGKFSDNPILAELL
jgi:uncharacterized delta-60 repeat protein